MEAWLRANRSDAALEEMLPELFEKIAELKSQRERWSATHQKFTSLNQDKKVELEKVDQRRGRLAKANLALAKADKAEGAARRDLAKLGEGKDEGAREVWDRSIRALCLFAPFVGLRGYGANRRCRKLLPSRSRAGWAPRTTQRSSSWSPSSCRSR